MSKTAGYYSKYGIRYLVSGSEELKALLLKFSENLGSGIRCHISNGAMLDYIIEHIPEIYNWFEVYPRPLKAVVTLCDKMKTYELAERLGVSSLKTFTADRTKQAEEYLSKGNRLIAKWNREFLLFGKMPFKTQLINGQSDLKDLILSLTEKEKRHVLFQQFVDTDQTHNISFLGYYVEGECICGLLGQQLRQYPQGITSYVREYTDKSRELMIEHARILFKQVKYTGFGEAEFKLRENFETAYLLEVNPRICGWGSALKAKYPDIARIFEEPNTSQTLSQVSDHAEWCNLLRDWGGIFNQSISRRSLMPLIKGAASYRKMKKLDVFDLHDMKPFGALIRRRLYGRG